MFRWKLAINYFCSQHYFQKVNTVEPITTVWQMVLGVLISFRSCPIQLDACVGNGEREAYEGHRLLESDRMVIWTKKRLVLLRGSGEFIYLAQSHL